MTQYSNSAKKQWTKPALSKTHAGAAEGNSGVGSQQGNGRS